MSIYNKTKKDLLIEANFTAAYFIEHTLDIIQEEVFDWFSALEDVKKEDRDSFFNEHNFEDVVRFAIIELLEELADSSLSLRLQLIKQLKDK